MEDKKTAYLIFDPDSLDDPDVKGALNRLGGYLREKKATVGVVKLPAAVNRELMGVDASGIFDNLVELAAFQNSGLLERFERSGIRFIKALQTLISEGAVVFGNADEVMPVASDKPLIGWRDANGDYCLNPPDAFAAVLDFYQRSGEPFTYRQASTWQDLKRLGFTVCFPQQRSTKVMLVQGYRLRVIQIKRCVLETGE